LICGSLAPPHTAHTALHFDLLAWLCYCICILHVHCCLFLLCACAVQDTTTKSSIGWVTWLPAPNPAGSCVGTLAQAGHEPAGQMLYGIWQWGGLRCTAQAVVGQPASYLVILHSSRRKIFAPPRARWQQFNARPPPQYIKTVLQSAQHMCADI
jgi:hypothetical protein